MQSTKKLALTFIFIALFAHVILAQQRLLVVGGGDRPPDAVKKFVEWSGGAKARILIITWASGVPEESFESLKKDFCHRVPGRSNMPRSARWILKNAPASSNSLKT